MRVKGRRKPSARNGNFITRFLSVIYCISPSKRDGFIASSSSVGQNCNTGFAVINGTSSFQTLNG